jgi:hypothetical protein
MGRKGVSKRKPKKSFSNDNTNKGSSNARPGAGPSVQSLANVKDAPLNRGGTNPSNGSNKKNQKGR